MTQATELPFDPGFELDEPPATVYRRVNYLERLLRSSRLVVIVVALALAAMALRGFNITRSFDVFVDEITYVRISDTAINTFRLELYGEPFLLHPPAFFFLEGAFLKLVNAPDDLIPRIYTARYLNVGLAGLSAGVLFLLVARITRWGWGLLAAGLFALDPFIIRINSQNLLDTAAIFWVLVGYWCLITGLDTQTGALSKTRILIVGVLFGLAVLTKDMMLCLTVLPLGMLFVVNWSLRRRVSVAISVVTAAVYGLYPLLILLSGDWDAFADQKLRGLSRLAGLVKETGFNREHGPSFFDKLIAKLGEFGVTYVLIGLGVFAVLLLLARRDKLMRIVAAWSVGAYALLGYCIGIGTLEEQFFYYLIVPVVLTDVLALAVVFGIIKHPILSRLLSLAVSVAIIAALALTAREWVLRHFTPDNAYETVYDYLKSHLPPERNIAATSETAQFLFSGYAGPPWGSWHGIEELVEHHPDYVLVSYQQVEWDYGKQARPFMNWVHRYGQLVYNADFRTNHIALFHLNWSTQSPDKPVNASTLFPCVTALACVER